MTARVYDDRERPNESELTLWVAGGKNPPRRDVSQEKVELIPDRKEYRAGDTAEILVQSPFVPAEGLLTLRRSGLVRTERFRMNEPSHTLRIPVEEGFTPNVYVQVDLVGAAARTDDKGEEDLKLPKRPAFASGQLNLTVPPLQRKLQVTATPRDKALEPGGETTVAVEVRDAAGRPVEGGEIAVVVVDESVLALTGYKLEDPVSIFYAQRGAGSHRLSPAQGRAARRPRQVDRHAERRRRRRGRRGRDRHGGAHDGGHGGGTPAPAIAHTRGGRAHGEERSQQFYD